jgi:hypothetical protein
MYMCWESQFETGEEVCHESAARSAANPRASVGLRLGKMSGLCWESQFETGEEVCHESAARSAANSRASAASGACLGMPV